jgi:pimeloyl-ACP methyl ester carboxylesterase
MHTSSRRLIAGAAALAVAGSLTVGAWPTRAGTPPAPTEPELGELVAGVDQYVRGTHVWTDYAYDDRGPNTNGLAGGDATYPSGSPGNEADLIQLQLGSRRGRLTVAALLETLRPDTGAVIGVGLDTDRNRETGAATVPGGQWKVGKGIGLEHLVVLDSAGTGTLLSWNGTELAEAAELGVAVDRDANLVSATVDALAVDGDTTWNVVGLAGRRAADGGSWLSGQQPIHDLAYLKAEDPTTEVAAALREQVPQLGFVPFQDKDQADVLSGRIDASRAIAADVTFTGSRTEAPEVDEGFNAFLYHSSIPVEEGVQPNPLRYDGPYMPYAVWISPGVNRAVPSPLLLFLHGANQYQNVNLIHFNNQQSLVLPSPYSVPGVVIFPNGRTTTWSTPLADADALEAMDDALARPSLNLDPERVVVTGVSSGGMGTYHLAAWYPDRFAGAYSLVGGGTEVLENITNLPFRASNGLLDPLVNATTWRDSADALSTAETVDYRIVQVLNRSHDGPLPEGNCYYVDLLSVPRVTNPTRVRYSMPVADKERTALGISPTGAYWVSRIEAADEKQVAKVDLESLAKDPRVVDQATMTEVQSNAAEERDFCRLHPGMRNGTTWEIEGRSFTTGTREAYANALRGSFANVDAVTVDVDRAGLDSGSPIALQVTTDRPVTVTLVGEGFRKVVVVGG